jgi:hypothetical protein
MHAAACTAPLSTLDLAYADALPRSQPARQAPASRPRPRRVDAWRPGQGLPSQFNGRSPEKPLKPASELSRGRQTQRDAMANGEWDVKVPGGGPSIA